MLKQTVDGISGLADKEIGNTSVANHGGSSHFFGIGISPVSDRLGISIVGRYRSPLFCIAPHFSPPFFPSSVGIGMVNTEKY